MTRVSRATRNVTRRLAAGYMSWTMAPLVTGRCACRCREPTIAEVLSDSIVRAIMEADGVDPAALEAELRTIARCIDAARERSSVDD